MKRSTIQAVLLLGTWGAVGLALPGCTPPPPPLVPEKAPELPGLRTTAPAEFAFADVTRQVGVDFTYRNGIESNRGAILEGLGGGVGCFDYDRDGTLDLFFTGGGRYTGPKELQGNSPVLYRSADGTHFSNVTLPANVGDAPFYNHGCSVGDFDNDGFPDLLMTGYGGLVFWINQGDGTFREAARKTGLTDTSWSTSAGWGDLNGDGNLDLYIAHYVNWSFENNPPCFDRQKQANEYCPPRQFEGLTDIAYYSNGDGTFRDATSEAKLVPGGKGLGVVLADVDNNGLIDVYVGNDTTNNFLYLNRDKGVLEEVGLVSGVAVDDRAVPNGSMGVDFGDYNSDGLEDIWVANYEDDNFGLYRNEGDGQFAYASREAGICDIPAVYVGFGTSFGDFDRDGDEDIVVSNGHAVLYPRQSTVRQLPWLLQNTRGHYKLLAFPQTSYLGTPHPGRGLATGDFDNDGDLDFATSNNNEPVAVLRNENPASGTWLGVRLIGIQSNRDAVGTRVVLHTTSGDQMRQVKGGGSYMSQCDTRLFWGLPAGAKITGLTIYWPGGTVQKETPALSNGYVTIVETAAN